MIPLGQPIDEQDLDEVDGVDPESRALLAARYGYAARDVLAVCAEQPALARRITPELPDLLAEAAFAARREQAQTIGDVLLRRTRVGLLDAAGVATADGDAPGAVAVAEALGGELGWDDERRQEELSRWREEARAEGMLPAS